MGTNATDPPEPLPPPAAGPAWYTRPWFIVISLLFCFPVGLFVFWRYVQWPTGAKAAFTALYGLLILVTLAQGPAVDQVATPTFSPASEPRETLEPRQERSPTAEATTTTAEVTTTTARTEQLLQRFEGAGGHTTRPFEVPDRWELRWDMGGESNNIIGLYHANGDLEDFPVNEIGPTQGTRYVPRGGSFYLEIENEGGWIIELWQVP